MDELLTVQSTDPSLTFLDELARRSFHTGRFRARSGVSNSWIFDCREALGSGNCLRQTAEALLRLARDRGIAQIAGAGFGAYLLVGAMLALGNGDFRGATLRSRPKSYGRRRSIEGSLEAGRPVWIVDDVLNSGSSALAAARVLRSQGCTVTGHASIFQFTWGEGVRRLEIEGISSHCLARVSKAPPVAETERRSKRNWFRKRTHSTRSEFPPPE